MRLDYISGQEGEKSLSLSAEIGKMLSALIEALTTNN